MYSLQRDVGASLEERSHAGDVPCAGGLHKRRAELLSMVVRVGAMLEQQQQDLVRVGVGVKLRARARAEAEAEVCGWG